MAGHAYTHVQPQAKSKRVFTSCGLNFLVRSRAGGGRAEVGVAGGQRHRNGESRSGRRTRVCVCFVCVGCCILFEAGVLGVVARCVSSSVRGHKRPARSVGNLLEYFLFYCFFLGGEGREREGEKGKKGLLLHLSNHTPTGGYFACNCCLVYQVFYRRKGVMGRPLCPKFAPFCASSSPVVGLHVSVAGRWGG